MSKLYFKLCKFALKIYKGRKLNKSHCKGMELFVLSKIIATFVLRFQIEI